MGFRRVVIAAIVAICIVVPAIEMFDRWDQTIQDGNDTEANVVIAALCVGLAFAIGSIAIVRLIRALLVRPRPRTVAVPCIQISTLALDSPIPTISPPTPLRI